MRYIEAPNDWPRGSSVFLAGGITDCPDWQHRVRRQLQDVPDLTIYNPRRADFDVNDPMASVFQVAWEYTYLQRADAVMFWFPMETLCPIVLFELGGQLQGKKPLFVGTHPHYQRRNDVLLQTRLARPEVTVGDDLDIVIGRVRMWASMP